MNPATPRDQWTGRDGLPVSTLLVDTGALAAELAHDQAPVLLDVRCGSAARRHRQLPAGHLPAAVFADLDRDLAGPSGSAGRRPLPDPPHSRPRRARPGSARAGQSSCTTTGTPRSPPAAGGRCAISGTRMSGCSTAATGPGSALVSRSPRPSPRRPPAISPRSPATCRCSTRRARRRRRGPGCCSTPGRGSATAGRPAGRPGRQPIPGAVSAPTAGNVNPDGTFSGAAELAARFAALGAVPGMARRAEWRSPPPAGLGRHRGPRGARPRAGQHPRRALRRLLVQLDRRPRSSRGDRRLALAKRVTTSCPAADLQVREA